MEGSYNNSFNNFNSENNFTEEKTARHKKIFVVLLSIFLFLVALMLIYYLFLMDRVSTTPIPVYAPAGGLGAKETLVPNDFPLPEGISFEQEFEKSLGGKISYSAIWSDLGVEKVELASKYNEYLTANGWETFYYSISEDLDSLSGKKDNIVINMFFRNNIDGKIDVEASFSQI